MKELVEVIARALVDNPDEVVVTETEKDGETFVELKVAPSDMGKVIGKQGRIAKAIRSVAVSYTHLDVYKRQIEAGYRSIDTAMIYHNEESVGEGIRRSGVPRKDIFLCSKVWNADIKARRTREAFSESLERLGTDYLDSYLLHWPVDGFKEAWEELEKLYDEGRIKVIGVSNFNISHLEELYRSARIQPMINQIESHPYLVQKERCV